MNKLNYQQSATECHDKLVDLCNKWEIDDSEGSTMRLDIDDEFMATIYSTVRILSKIRGNERCLSEDIHKCEYNGDCSKHEDARKGKKYVQ